MIIQIAWRESLDSRERKKVMKQKNWKVDLQKVNMNNKKREI